jgi:competence protein ComEA
MNSAPLVVLTFLALSWARLLAQEPLQVFKNCQLIETEWADGDSFLVKLPDGEEEVFRLYFVDCIERTISTDSDRQRLREQSQHFGITDYAVSRDFGTESKAFTDSVLSKPFTVFTSFADARGRSGKRRSYAFVYTSEGNDLAALLVSNGLARAMGVSRETPAGNPGSDHMAYLMDLELAAAVKKTGAWSASNPEALVAMREERRAEIREMEAIDLALEIAPPASPIDVNTASLEELTRAGLRESLADLLIKGRPFATVDDILRVSGIGPKTLEKVKPHLMVTKQGS